MIRKMLWPLIKKQRLLFSVIVLIATISTSMTASLLSLNLSFKQDCINYINDYQLPDGYLKSDDEITKEDAEKIYTIDGVEEVNLRWNMNVQIFFRNNNIIANVRSYNDNSFPKFHYYEKTARAKNYYPNILITKSLADINHLILRGQFEVNIDKIGLTQKFVINGIVDSPETMRTELSRGVLIDSHDFGYAYIHEEEIAKYIPEMANKGNEIIIRTKANVNHETVVNAAKELLSKQGYRFADTYTKEMTTTYQFIYDNIFHYIDIIAFAVPLAFALITLILIFLFMYQIIKGMMREIGIMSALGITKKSIFGLMSAFALSIGGGASLLGVLIAIPIASTAHRLIGTNYNMPIGNGQLNYLVIILAILITLLTAFLSSLITILTIRHITPINAINNRFNQSTKTSNLVKKITPKLSTKTSIIFSSLRANKTRGLIAVLAIAAVFMLFFTSINIITAANYNVNQINERLNFDARVYEFEEKEGVDFFPAVKALPSVKQLEKSYTIDTTITFNDKVESLTLTALEDNHSFLRVPNRANKECSIIDDGIIIEEILANKLHIKVGDNVTIANKILKVNDISRMSLNKINCISYNTASKLDIEKYKVALINVTNKEQFTNEIRSLTNCISIFSNNVVNQYTKDTSSVILVMGIVAIFAFLIGTTVVFAMQLLIFNQEKRKYCIMEMIGFTQRNIIGFSIAQLLIYLVIGVVIGILPALLLAQSVLNVLSTSYATFYFFSYYWFYLLAIALIIVSLILINIYTIINLKRTKIAQFVNSRE